MLLYYLVYQILKILLMPRIKYKAKNSEAFDREPVQVKVMPGVREKLKSISNWQDKLRGKIDLLITENLDSET
jgi:hypothetical protein